MDECLEDTNDLSFGQTDDTFLHLHIYRGQYAVYSFACGGLPYLGRSGIYKAEAAALIRDILLGQLTQRVLELFDGLDMSTLGTQLPCRITDHRTNPPTDKSIMLVPALHTSIPKRKYTTLASLGNKQGFIPMKQSQDI